MKSRGILRVAFVFLALVVVRQSCLALDELNDARLAALRAVQQIEGEEDEKGKRLARRYFQGEAKDVRSGCHEEQFGSVIATKEQIEFLYVHVRASGSSGPSR